MSISTIWAWATMSGHYRLQKWRGVDVLTIFASTIILYDHYYSNIWIIISPRTNSYIQIYDYICVFVYTNTFVYSNICEYTNMSMNFQILICYWYIRIIQIFVPGLVPICHTLRPLLSREQVFNKRNVGNKC